MWKINIVILLVTIIFTNCSGTKEPIIKMGTELDKTKMEISGETSVFKQTDNFSYTLSQKKPFQYPVINRRFYKGNVYIDLLRLESKDITIESGSKKIGESIPVSQFVFKYGGGDYMLIFVVNEEVIAKKPFIIEGPAIKGARSEEQPRQEGMMPQMTSPNFPEQNNAIKNMEPEKTMTPQPEKIKMLSPGDMMKDQK
ncbi:MAG: hypothetical protein V1874_06650 [Spirochaetota bacterium]